MDYFQKIYMDSGNHKRVTILAKGKQEGSASLS